MPKGFKLADVDPRLDQLKNCAAISDKARCIVGSVLELVSPKRAGKGVPVDKVTDLPGHPELQQGDDLVDRPAVRQSFPIQNGGDMLRLPMTETNLPVM